MIKATEKPTRAGTRGRRIMLVDDDRFVLGTLSTGLAARGYAVESFDDAAAAIEAYVQSPPDLAILDLRLSGSSGTDVARAMLQHKHRPILMLSAYDDQSLVREAISIGVSGYLVKPIEVSQVVPSIEATLARFAEISALMENSANLHDCVERNRVISTAVGIVMERVGLGPDQAFEQLRWLARDRRKPLRDIAHDLVEGLATVNLLTGGRDKS